MECSSSILVMQCDASHIYSPDPRADHPSKRIPGKDCSIYFFSEFRETSVEPPPGGAVHHTILSLSKGPLCPSSLSDGQRDVFETSESTNHYCTVRVATPPGSDALMMTTVRVVRSLLTNDSHRWASLQN